MPTTSILIIEDDAVDAKNLLKTLNSTLDDYLDVNFDIEIRQGFLDGLNALNHTHFDIVLLDLQLPDAPEIQKSLQDLHEHYPNTAIIVMTGFKDRENALQSLQNGAQDYLINGETTPRELRRSITYAIERHRLKSELVHYITQLRKVEKLKDEFISTVSHELRTPLTSISGSLGLIAGGVVCKLPERATTMINIAQRNSDRLVRLINDLLDVQKLAAGKVKLNLKPISASAFIDKSIELNQGYALPYGVKYLINNELKTELYIKGDEDRLLQVMANLLSNAAKFSPPDSNVLVSISEGPSHSVLIRVKDQGPGIPKQFHANIFEKFSQADSYTKQSKGGTGLGLSICKSIIDLHNGHIGFETGSNKGTTFHFRVPKHITMQGSFSTQKRPVFLQQIPFF